MDQSEEQQQQQPAIGSSSAQLSYSTPYQTGAMVVSGAPAVAVTSTQTAAGFSAYQQAQQFQQQQQQQQQQQLHVFWTNQIQEIEQTADFKNHSLPLARIKKIMKADEDVRMISAEAPVVFAKACEMFILELTLRSWIHTEENKRRTLQKNDIAAAITRTDIFDFLVDIVPRDELKEEGLGIPRVPTIGAPADSIPYYYVPPPHQVGAPAAAALYASQPRPSVPYVPSIPWPNPPQQQQTQQSQQQHTNA
ncbi:nuclear transcription factor Y subunit C-2-like [Telopea speciosissima]|uniref:nuclear transcription factor Y subunit C-2-like n=1 Tax=Telopea speciosissima TaxID=54955 RepID=UPI001CC37F8C|nr:nuclear transcription factor Y subunit C-2-like [Telopea speciosissima]